jgi:hypothetical protein
MCDLSYYLNEQEKISKGGAKNLLDTIAKKLGEDSLCLENLIKTIFDDLHVVFLRILWKEANPKDSEDSK